MHAPFRGRPLTKHIVSGGSDCGVCGREDSVTFRGPSGGVFGGRLSGSADGPFLVPFCLGLDLLLGPSTSPLFPKSLDLAKVVWPTLSSFCAAFASNPAEILNDFLRGCLHGSPSICSTVRLLLFMSDYSR